MNESKCHLTVIYLVLPLVFLSFCLGPVVLAIGPSAHEESIDVSAHDAFSTLSTIPVSLMSRETSGNLYSEMKAIRELFVQYNQQYGSRLDINTATGSSATLSRMQSYILTTERMHLTAHGSYGDEGPTLQLYGGYLTSKVVKDWSLESGLCKLVYLSACNGMGKNGMLNTDLAYNLRRRTSVETVLGFKDEISIVTATTISQSFWMFHVTYSFAGGMSAGSSYLNTLDRINNKILIAKVLAVTSVATAVSYLVAQLGLSALGSAFISSLLGGITTELLLEYLFGEMERGLNNWEIYGNHDLPGLWWYSSGGGGGGGSGPIHLPY